MSPLTKFVLITAQGFLIITIGSKQSEYGWSVLVFATVLFIGDEIVEAIKSLKK